MPKIELIHGDCIEEMDKLIERGIKVDAIITDPPYGTTACKWDSVIPFNEMWERLNKLIKPNGAIVLFGSEPFSSALRMSNIKHFKYDWIWDKVRPSGFQIAEYCPMKRHEIISIFNSKIYIRQMELREKPVSGKVVSKSESSPLKYNDGKKRFYTHKNPQSIIKFNKSSDGKYVHPTQKPVALMEYLIKTYTNKGETVLDFTMGSGTTGVACKNLNRDFIGIEIDSSYFKIAENRIYEEELAEDMGHGMKIGITLIQDDCLNAMNAIPDESVDMILADLPYGMTACKWDSVISLEHLWKHYKRVIKANGVIALTAIQPFASTLVMSNIEWFKYCWYWDKKRGTGFLNSKKQPLRCIEEILIFYKNQPKYKPQMRRGFRPYSRNSGSESRVYGRQTSVITSSAGDRYPLNLLSFDYDQDKLHPTQKPVALCEYLIKTYTDVGDLVLDNCMGSGTTGIACINLYRSFVGIELDAHIFSTADDRIDSALQSSDYIVFQE